MARPAQIVRVHVSGYLPMHLRSMPIVLVGSDLLPRPHPCKKAAISNPSSGAAGSNPIAKLFERDPFTISRGGSGSSQYTTIDGLVSDAVHDLKVFLASGDVIDMPLRDNAYRADVARSGYPIRVVAYDAQGRVIGIQTFASDGMTNPAPPEARTSVRELMRVTADGSGREPSGRHARGGLPLLARRLQRRLGWRRLHALAVQRPDARRHLDATRR